MLKDLFVGEEVAEMICGMIRQMDTDVKGVDYVNDKRIVVNFREYTDDVMSGRYYMDLRFGADICDMIKLEGTLFSEGTEIHM